MTIRHRLHLSNKVSRPQSFSSRKYRPLRMAVKPFGLMCRIKIYYRVAPEKRRFETRAPVSPKKVFLAPEERLARRDFRGDAVQARLSCNVKIGAV
jgi:hypothetical protein